MNSVKQKLVLLIAIATLLKLVIASSIGLGNDEVYYLTYAQILQWNYFDHPPIVALLIKLSTFNLSLTSDLFVRIGAILLSGINTYIVYKIGKEIKNERAGYISAILYTASIYSSIIAGLFIMPDAPQLFFWMISLLMLIKIVKHCDTKPHNLHIILFGIFSGLCIMSKIHGVFLWFGFGLYILIYNRKLLQNQYLYLSFLITLIIISPILIWNINNDFITYSFHSERVTIKNTININSFIREIFGNVFYNNPVNFILIVLSITALLKNKIVINLNIKRLLLLLGLPIIICVLLISLFRDTLPHWSGPGYTTLLIITGCYIEGKTKQARAFLAVKYAVFLILFISIAGVFVINFYPGTLSNKTATNEIGKNDTTLDMYNWRYFKDEFKTIYNHNKSSNTTQTTFVINNKWFPGAHIDNYIAQPLNLDFIAIGNINDIHTYYWLNTFRKKINLGDDAYYITFSNYYSDPNTIYKNSFKKINKPIIVKQFRNGKHVRNMFVYLMEDYQGENLEIQQPQ